MDLSGGQVDEEGWEFCGQRFERVRRLNLSGGPTYHLQFFENLAAFPSLEELDLSNCGLEWMRDWLDPGFVPLPAVKSLNLSHNRIRDASGLETVAPYESLRHLDLSYNQLMTYDAAQLLELPLLQNLTCLNLAHNSIEGWISGNPGDSMASFLESPLMERLELLDLSGNQIGDDGFWHFINCTIFGYGYEETILRSGCAERETILGLRKIRVPKKLILRGTNCSAEYQQKLREEFGDRIEF